MPATTPPSRRAPQGRKPAAAGRAAPKSSGGSRSGAPRSKSRSDQGAPSPRRSERGASPARRDGAGRDDPRASTRAPSKRRSSSDDRPAGSRSATGAKRASRGEYAPRAPSDGDDRSARPSRPYRKPGDDSRPARQRDSRNGPRGDDRAPREVRDGDDRSSRPARPYRKSGESATAPRGGPRGASSRSSYSRTRDTREPAPLTPEQRKRQAAGEHARDKGWGSVARKGAINITSTGQELGDAKSRTRTPDPLGDFVSADRPTPRKAPEEKAKTRAKYSLPGDVSANVRKAFIGTAYMREKMVNTLTRAAEAYDRKRYEEALRLGRIVADATPGVAAVRELTGLAAYRADRWAMSRIHLRAYFTISGDPEHLPLVMDADRANHKYRAVEKTFAELQESEPSPEVLAEGRIVMAATWADQRKYEEAIDLLTRAGAAKNLRNPSYRHVRLWYALADVYDRAGDTTAARELFSRVVLAEPDAYDAAARLGELGATVPRKNRKRRATPVSKKKVD